MTRAEGPWHKRGMTDTKTNTHPYTLEVERNLKSEGAWQWSIRQHGKLVERSDRALASEVKARANGMEKIEKMLHGGDEARR